MTRPTDLFIQVCMLPWTQTAPVNRYSSSTSQPKRTSSGTWHYRYRDFYNSVVQLNVPWKIVTRLLSLEESTPARSLYLGVST